MRGGAAFAGMALALALGACCAAGALAVPAPGTPGTVRQPDGTSIRLYLVGDEHYNWLEDLNHYPVVRVNGEYRYATHDAGGELVATPYRVGAVDPAAVGLRPGHRPGPAARLRIQQQRAAMQQVTAAITPANGTVHNLVILAQFSDHGSTMIRPPADYDSVMNAKHGDPTVAPSGSLRTVWQENSYNALDIVSTVQPWVMLPNTEAYYADGNQGKTAAKRDQMVTDALTAADATVNFADFDRNNDGYVDAIDVIHSGYSSEGSNGDVNRIWSQQWTLATDWTSNDRNANGTLVKVSRVHTEAALWGSSGTDICRIGVIAHETGHFFGLPDLYDYDYDGMGVGLWCLMGDCWGWAGDQRYPPELCAWSKIQLGYMLPTVLTSPGPQYVGQSVTSSTVYRIDLGYSGGEYLLIENREPTGFDREMPQGGIAIWHIDDNRSHNAGDPFNQYQGYPGQTGWPQNGNHYGVALLQADGNYDLEKLAWAGHAHGDAGDLWRAGGISLINESTVPSTDRYVTYFNPTGNEIRVTTTPQAIMGIDYRPALWVDFAFGGLYLGTFDNPYNTLAGAEAAAPANWGIVCKTGTTSERPTLTKPLTYRSWNGPSTIGP